ncbi:MAG TPA: kelch repeat-containing protein [Thermoplasmata archaeon]|nr:kelch repeat-containing protein [Thermoplasmata archaeon]
MQEGATLRWTALVLVVSLLSTSVLTAVGTDSIGSRWTAAPPRQADRSPALSPVDIPPGSGYTWTNPCQCPSGRNGHTMVYDSLSDRFILFGGWDGRLSNETWAYDLDNNQWTRMQGFNGPSARQGHLSVYDSRADRVLLYGGDVGGTASPETWAYSYQADTWTNMSPPLSPPPGLSGAMAYDAESGRAILFGAPFRGASETWAYDLSANHWTNMTAGEAQRPSPRWGHAMAYDSRADRIILFGGQASSGSDETWAYDFNTNTWTNRNPTTKPSWRYRHAMDYDVGSDRIVLFGGFAATGVNGETWSYDFMLNTWSMLGPAMAPTGRYAHTMVFHVPSNRTILYGGTGNAAGLGHEIWAYESGTNLWTRVDPDRPAGAGAPVMAYDVHSDRVILFGGVTPLGWSETWAHDLASNAWTFMDPSSKPVGTFTEAPAMAYDSAANLTILFSQGATWAYDFGLNAWTILQPSGSPSSRRSAAMAYDSESRKVILFGGETGIIPFPWVNDTWAYDFNTNTWTNMTPGEGVRPPPGSGYLMAHDSQSDRTILFGGSTGVSGHNETWAYDFNTNTWTNMMPAVSPSVDDRSTMAYDSRMDRVIVQGRGETWLYDVGSNAWTNVSGGATPSTLRGTAMAFDIRAGRSVVFAYDDTWWGRLLAPPTPPTNVRPTNRNGRVTLDWKPPIDGGGSPVSAYRIHRGTSPGTESFYAEVGNVLTFEDLGATAGVRYYYQVSAVNAEGEGQRSVEVTNLPPAPPPSSAWEVAHTLVLLNNTLMPGNFIGANGWSPLDATYDTGKSEVYMTNYNPYYPDAVSVISGVTHTVIATIGLPVGSSPQGVAYDAGKGEVFVANYGSNTVSVISDETHTVIATIGLPVGSSPQGVAYDAGKGEVFVTNYISNTVSVISDATNSVLASIPVDSRPWGLAHDDGKGEVFVANSNSNTVSVISDATNTVVASIPVGNSPIGVAYDAAKSELFVSSYPISVISDVSNTVVATIGVVDHPWGLAYDAGKGEVFFANFFSDTVSVLSDATNTFLTNISTGYHPRAIAYASGRGEVFVGNYGDGNINVISDATNAVVATIPLQANPSGIAYDAGKGEIFVADGFRDIVSVISVQTNTVVATIPLPRGSSPWGVAYDSGKGEIFVTNRGTDTISVISDATNTVVATILLSGPLGLAYDSGKGEIFAVNVGARTVSVISDATNTVVATIPLAPASNPWGVVYNSGKGEIFVTDQGADTISVISDETNTVVATISLFVGGGPVSLAYDDRNGEIYFANVNSDDVRVISDATNRVVANIPVGTRPFGVAYNNLTGEIFVTNSGSNTVSVISEVTKRVVDTVQVGGDPFWIACDPKANSLYVSNPNTGSISILSRARIFNVSFVEQGLQVGTLWSVTLDGMSVSSTGSEITLPKRNGTYSFTVEKVPGYVASPRSGEVTVDGAAVTQTVMFLPTRQTVTFGETGLPAGTPWWINLTNGESFAATSATIRFTEQTGWYAFMSATADKRYASAAGTFTVEDSPVTQTVTFSPVTFQVVFTQTGLPPGTSWSVTLNGVSQSSNETSIAYSEMNGSYSFVVTGPGGYSASPASGNLAVHGEPVSIAIQFSSTPVIVLYAVGAAVATVAGGVMFILFRRKRRARPPSG